MLKTDPPLTEARCLNCGTTDSELLMSLPDGRPRCWSCDSAQLEIVETPFADIVREETVREWLGNGTDG